MKKSDKFIVFIISVVVYCFGAFMGGMLQEHDCKYHNYPQNITSIEYLETCQCGSELMECYKSFKDGYEYKECKECGSHYSNGEKVIINEN